jgi:NTE family protein
LRATDIALQQGINMRRRVLFGLERTGERQTVYWGVGEPVDIYRVGNPLNFTAEETRQAAAVPTRLTRYSVSVRTCVLRAGYAHADAALRASKLMIPINTPPSFDDLPTVT